MAKKVFNTSVATAWLSQDNNPSPSVEATPAPAETVEAVESNDKVTDSENEVQEEEPAKAEKAKAAKKSTESATVKKAKQEAKFVLNPSRELKSRRTSVLLKTSIYDKINELAKSNNTSFNDCLNQILEQVLPE